MDMKVSSTIGFERAHNPTLSIEDEDEFVEEAVSKLGPQPPNFEAIVELNKGPLQTKGVEALPLTPRQLEQLRADGALVVDVRTDQQFDDAHISGAVSIPILKAGFGSKLAWLAKRDQQIVLVGRDGEDGRRAMRLATAVGLTNIAGYLDGGHTSWRQDRRDVEKIERLPLEELHERAEEDGLQILDVRERAEWERGHIPDSVFEPWHDIERIPEGLDPEEPVAVVCGSGERSAVAASLLQRLGARDVIHVIEGGVPKWGRLGHPLVQES
jgi:rhodanese-related sulfurtransferase